MPLFLAVLCNLCLPHPARPTGTAAAGQNRRMGQDASEKLDGIVNKLNSIVNFSVYWGVMMTL